MSASVYNSRSYKSRQSYHATIPSIHLIRKIQEAARILSRPYIEGSLSLSKKKVWPSPSPSPSYKNWPLDWLSIKIVCRLSPAFDIPARYYLSSTFWVVFSMFHIGGAFRAVERQAHAVCDYVIRANASSTTAGGAGGGSGGGETMMNRWSGFFSTSSTAWRVWPAPCSFTFPVQPGQSVQINLLTFNITYVHYKNHSLKVGNYLEMDFTAAGII